MTRRSLHLLMPLLLVGCQAAPAIQAQPAAHLAVAPVSLATRVAKVDTLTKSLSLAGDASVTPVAAVDLKTPALATAVTTLAPVTGSIAQTLLLSLTSLLGAGTIAKFLPGASYQLFGVSEDKGLQFGYDDDTHELTSVTGTDARVEMTFKNDGKARTWDAVMGATHDGTTGECRIQAAGDWIPQPASSKPYKVFGGEMPIAIDSLALHLDVVPKGDRTQANSLDLTLDDPADALLPGVRLPRHVLLHCSGPQRALDLDTRLSFGDQAGFVSSGALVVGGDRFDIAGRMDASEHAIHFTITNDDAKLKIQVDTDLSKGHATTTALLLATDDGSQLGTVSLDAHHPGLAVITLNDGTTHDWPLWGGSLPTL